MIVEVNDKEKFVRILKGVPELAKIESYEVKPSEKHFNDFTIKESEGKGFAEIPPDLFLCKDCQKELKDSTSRRHNYYFTTCTNCGPRFSIAKKSPYDRKTITMDSFEMCPECHREYTDPKDRRYHAQTIACHNCGPRLQLFREGREVKSANELELIEQTVKLIKNSKVVAIKGIGGFHLACSLQKESIKELRAITARPHKPFAVMCRDIDMAKKIAHISKKEADILQSVQRPILILKKKASLKEISELDTIGIMLPYTALHYLLFDYIGEPIVMTSSNISDQPITTASSQQNVQNILNHTRPIENPIDDSLVKIIQNKNLLIRRSRGFVPQSIPLKTSCHKQILALGAELSNTFCLFKDKKAIFSPYMGTTSDANTFNSYKKMVSKFLAFTQCKPEVILADAHPAYNTSIYAQELSEEWNIPLIRVQHHKAHACSVAQEHNLTDFAAIVCDGLGYGEDETIWGGEVFYNNKRTGHLEQHYQLGGDSAAKYPAKMLFSILSKFLPPEECSKHMRNYFTQKELAIMRKQLNEQFNCPLTSSCGRILDAAAFMLGLCNERTYEGRPAMLLEAHSSIPYDMEPVIENNVLLTTPLFRYLIENKEKDRKRLAATAQLYLAKGLHEIASEQKKPIVFSGGCAYNTIMSSYMIDKGVYLNKQVPSGDGGISFGQIAYYLKTNF